MKKEYKIYLLFTAILFTGCVQQTHNKTVEYHLDPRGIKDIKSVGIRGNDKPLSWERDYPMVFDPKDSMYKATVTTRTGYLFTEIKFTINEKVEFKGEDKRTINFVKGTLVYRAKYNVRN